VAGGEGVSEDDAPLDLMAYVLAGGTNSRLYKRLGYDMQVAQDVSAFNNAQRLDGGFQRPRALARSSSWTSPDGRRCRAPR